MKPIWIISFVFATTHAASYAQPDMSSCSNPVSTPYSRSPLFFSPDGTRGVGVKIWIKGNLSEIPDTSAKCLPIALRYNNPGVIKTPSKNSWPNQIGKDSKGHAVFPTVEAGIVAWGLWMKKKFQSGVPQTAMSIMSVYAPPFDCVGTIGVFPDCPYGANPTAAYAQRVASGVGKEPNDVLNLDGSDCKEGRAVLYHLFQEIATFEIGANFCGRERPGKLSLCIFDRGLFDKALDSVFGPVESGKCP